MKLLAILFLSFNCYAWQAVSGYPETVLVKNGQLVQSIGEYPNHIQLAKFPDSKLFGIAVYNKNINNYKKINSADFIFNGCKLSLTGKINKISFVVNNQNTLEKLLDCQLSFLRIYDNDIMATYIIRG